MAGTQRPVVLRPHRASLERHGITTFERKVTPAGTVGLDDVVVVEYTVAFGKDGDMGCWAVTDFAPSGLAPIGSDPDLWYDEEGLPTGTEGPWSIVGQRVDFCPAADPRQPGSRTLRYVARVVTPGTYRWEPARIQSTVAPEWGQVIPATTMEISSR